MVFLFRMIIRLWLISILCCLVVASTSEFQENTQVKNPELGELGDSTIEVDDTLDRLKRQTSSQEEGEEDDSGDRDRRQATFHYVGSHRSPASTVHLSRAKGHFTVPGGRFVVILIIIITILFTITI